MVVLESPHFDEYDMNTHQAKGPAHGVTGRLFEKWFLHIFNRNFKIFATLDKNLIYTVVFINSVQYQSSQGIKTLNTKIRDCNWLAFWNNGFALDLQQRLCFFGSNSVVINMCTYGKKRLHEQVQRRLRSTSLQLFEAYHPSCWWRSRRRRFW